jgi:pyrroline-5-carboxylate reductase
VGSFPTPVLMVGAGQMGGALIAGWRRSGALGPADLILRDPHPGAEAARAAADGATLNGPDGDLARARVVILAVKPQTWRPAALSVAPLLAPDAVLISIMAGVAAADLSDVFAGRAIVRVMPTTAASVNKGATSLWSADPTAREAARALFAPLGVTVDLADEALMHVATAASGSAPAYVYALIEALEAAGAEAGLSAEAARALSRSALIGAAALLEGSGEAAAELRRQVTSPGGTTEAALRVLIGDDALGDLISRAVRAAVARSEELGSR